MDHWLSTNRTLSWKKRPDYALHDLCNLLFAPQIHHDIKSHSNYIIGVGTTTKPKEVSIEIAFPAHIANQSDIDLALWWKDRRTDEWHRLDREKSDAFANDFWNAASLRFNPQFTGWQLNISEAFIREHNHTCTIKVEASYYPAGKGQNVIEGFNNEYVLPVSQRDETGELEKPVTKIVEEIYWGISFTPNLSSKQ